MPQPKIVPEAQSSHATTCFGVSDVLGGLGDKWTMLLVLMLRRGTLRFGEIKRQVPGISQRMLTLTLRGLERDGLVKRTPYPTVPPRVDYELTPLGHSLSEPIDALGAWALAHEDQIRGARRNFDIGTSE